MAQIAADPEAPQAEARQNINQLPSIIPAHPGRQPIRNLAAFMASLPDVEPEEADTFEEAIAQNRAMRRANA